VLSTNCILLRYLCRTLGWEGSLKACLVPLLTEMDCLVSSILACDQFFATTGAGSHINAQSLPIAQRCEWLRRLSHRLCFRIKAYLCRTLGRECSLKACLVPFLSQMDSLISGILASNKFFTTAGTGSHINAQSLSSARLNGVSVILHTFAGPLAGKAISKQALCHSLPKWTVLSPVSLPVTSSLPHPGQAVTSMPNPYRVQG